MHTNNEQEETPLEPIEEIITPGARLLSQEDQQQILWLSSGVIGFVIGYVFYTSGAKVVEGWEQCEYNRQACSTFTRLNSALIGDISWSVNNLLFTGSLIASVRERYRRPGLFSPFPQRQWRAFLELVIRAGCIIAGGIIILPPAAYSLGNLFNNTAVLCRVRPDLHELGYRDPALDVILVPMSALLNAIVPYGDSTRRVIEASRRYIQGIRHASDGRLMLYGMYGLLSLGAVAGFSYNNARYLHLLYTLLTGSHTVSRGTTLGIWLSGVFVAILRLPFFLDFGVQFLEYLTGHHPNPAIRFRYHHLLYMLIAAPSVLGITGVTDLAVRETHAEISENIGWEGWLWAKLLSLSVAAVGWVINVLRLPPILDNAASAIWSGGNIMPMLGLLMLLSAMFLFSLLDGIGLLDVHHDCPRRDPPPDPSLGGTSGANSRSSVLSYFSSRGSSGASGSSSSSQGGISYCRQQAGKIYNLSFFKAETESQPVVFASAKRMDDKILPYGMSVLIN